MPTPANLPLSALIDRSRTAFTNALADAEIAAALAPYGYDTARLDGLLDLVEDVEAKSGAQASEYAEQYAASSALADARAALAVLYGRHRQLARLAHARGGDGYRALGLSGNVPGGAAALATQADTFYRVLQTTPALAASVAPVAVDAAALTAGRAAVEAVRAATAEQAKETGDAQRATAVRDDAVVLLRASLSDLATVARLALAPQVRERLGMLDRS